MNNVSLVDMNLCHIPDHLGGLQSLRDFFAATNAGELLIASEGIARHFGVALRDDIDWVEVEYDFNRLFVGPAALPSPPYASAYGTEPTLMGAPALEARDLYRRMGLAVPDQGSVPDDHLAFELDAALGLAVLEASESERATDAATMRQWLVDRHMSGWVPKFIRAVRDQQDASAPVLTAVAMLERWLNESRTQNHANQHMEPSSGEEDVHDETR